MKPHDQPPTTWVDHPMHASIRDAGGGVYYAILESDEPLIRRIWVWHRSEEHTS